MRTLNRLRLIPAVLALGTIGFAIAGDDVPPPYPSISPASGSIPVPAVPQLPPTAPVTPPPTVTPVTPVLPQLPLTAPVTPPPTVTPVVPQLPATTPVMPVLPLVAPTTPVTTPPTVTPVLPQLPPTTLPITNPGELPKTVAPVTTPPVVTPIVKTEPAKPSTVSIKIGTTPGIQDHVGKLSSAITESRLAYERLMDYSCHFIKQEKIDGKLSGELIYELHARTKPMSIYLKLVEPKSLAGTEICFVSGKYALNQVRVKQANGAFTTVALEDSRSATGRHTADQIGIGAILDRFDKAINTEMKLGNPIGVTVGDFVYAGRTVTRYEMVCERSHAYRSSYRAVVFIDKELKLPIRYEAYDEPKNGGNALLECVSFVNLKTNVGHAAAVFDR